MAIANIIAFVLVLVGAINWGLVGIFDWNLVSAIFGAGRTVGSSIVYILVLIAGLWLLVSLFLGKGRLYFMPNDNNDHNIMQ